MKDNIDPKWAWFWESKPVVALPFWEDAGRPRNYGYGLPELEFADIIPSWSFGPRGYGVQAPGISTGTPSPTSDSIEFGAGNLTSGSISSGSLFAGFVGATMFTPAEYSASNPNNDPQSILTTYGSAPRFANGYRDGPSMYYVNTTNQWKIQWQRQNTFQLIYPTDGSYYEPRPGEYFSLAFYIEEENKNGHMLLNGVEVQTRTNFFGDEDVGDLCSVGGRSFWDDYLWPSPIYCVYWWIKDRGSTIPGEAQLQQLHDDPWGPFRHYREELHPNVYPAARNVSQRFVSKGPPKPAPWSWDSTYVVPEWERFGRSLTFATLFDEGGGSPHDIITNERATTANTSWDYRDAGVGLTFDTNTDECYWASSDQHAIDTDEPFFCMWYGHMNSPPIGDAPAFISRRTSFGAGYWTLYIAAAQGIESGQLGVYLRDASTTETVISTYPIANHYDGDLLVGFSRDTGGIYRLYVNGKEIGSGTKTLIPGNDAQVLNVGKLDQGDTINYMRATQYLAAIGKGWSPSADEWVELAKDPFAPFRHKQDTIHTNVYPAARNVSQRFSRKLPPKPEQWNIDQTQLRPEFENLDVMFAWEGGTSLVDRNSGTQAILGSEYGQNQVVQEHFGDVLDFISDPNPYGTGVKWSNAIDQDYLKSGGPISLEALIKVDTDAPNDATAQIICAVGKGGSSPYSGSVWLYCRNSNGAPDDGLIDVVAQRRTSGDWQGISNGSVRIPKNQWVHVVVTISAFTGGPIKLYVNGILRRTESASGGSGVIDGANSSVIVSDPAGGEEFHGKIAYTRVYRDVLDQSQIQMLSKDPWGPIRHYRETQPVRILAPQFASHLSVIVNSNATGNPIIISPVPSNGSFMTIS